jgi:hypothetical protein
MRQQIGNRAGEAATWSQLGALATATGDLRKALQLAGLCFLIDREIGHGKADNDFRAVAQLAGRLDLTPEQLAAELESVARTYAQDRGASLLQEPTPARAHELWRKFATSPGCPTWCGHR